MISGDDGPKFSRHLSFFVNNNGFRYSETLNLYNFSGIWGPARHLSLKITNSLAIFRLTKPLKPQPGLPATGFEPGTSRMRGSCVTTEPPRSVDLLFTVVNPYYKTFYSFCINRIDINGGLKGP